MDLSRVMKNPVPHWSASSWRADWPCSRSALLSTWLLPSGLEVQNRNLVWHDPAPRMLEIWARWDSEWYLLVADQGYQAGGLVAASNSLWDQGATAGFLPLYPLLIRALSPIVGSVGAGVLISNICLFLSLIALERLVRLELGDEAGGSAGLVACGALLAFPSSLFLSAVYPESLFLALSIAVFLSVRTGRFAAAGVLGGLATLTRPFGVLLVLPILLEWWSAWRSQRAGDAQRHTRLLDLLWAGLIPAALGIYMAFCGSVFGDPLAFVHHKTRWRGALSGPWTAFTRWWEAGPTAHGSHGSTFELIIAVACLVGLVAMARRLRISYTIYASAAVVLALGSTLWSFSRLALTLFPFSMLIGALWAEGRRCLPVLYAFIGVTISGLFMALFANWWWVG